MTGLDPERGATPGTAAGAESGEPGPGGPGGQGETPLPGGSFRLLVQKLAYQALMSLGAVENPLSGERDVNLPQARMVIDDLCMLERKTSGNLDPEEEEYLRGVIAELEKHHDARAGTDKA